MFWISNGMSRFVVLLVQKPIIFVTLYLEYIESVYVDVKSVRKMEKRVWKNEQ